MYPSWLTIPRRSLATIAYTPLLLAASQPTPRPDVAIEAVAAAIRAEPRYLEHATLVVDTSGLRPLGHFDEARLALLASRLDSRARLSVPSLEAACQSGAGRRCVRFRVVEYEQQGTTVFLVGGWGALDPGRCASSTAIKFRMTWDGSSMEDPVVVWREYYDCGAVESRQDTAAVRMAAARRLRTDYPRGRPAFQGLAGSFGGGSAARLDQEASVLATLLAALNADLLDTPRWLSETLRGFAEFAMHFARTAVGWEFVRLGQGRQETLTRSPQRPDSLTGAVVSPPSSPPRTHAARSAFPRD